MKKSIFYIILASIILFTTANAKNFEILKPHDKNVYDDKFATLSIKINDLSLQKIQIVLNSFHKFELKIDGSRNVYCKTLKLRFGKNKIDIISYKDNNKSDKESISLYVRSEMHEGYSEEPSGYKKQLFHSDENEKLCSSCHNMKPDTSSLAKKNIAAGDINYKDLEVLENPEDSNCYNCHNELVNRKVGHAPSVNFMCSECHNGKAGDFNIDLEGKSKYLVPDPVMGRCFSCHEGIEDKWMSNKSEHGPLKTGRCNKCHNPHSSPNEFHLRKPIWKLCTTCHSKKASGAHVIASFVKGKTHPTRRKPDPARPGRELVCSGCHNPHGSNSVFLLRTEGKNKFSICTRCHKDKK